MPPSGACNSTGPPPTHLVPTGLLPHWILQEGWRDSLVLGRMLALGFQEGRVMLVNGVTGEVRWSMQDHAGGAKVAMSPSGRFVASVGRTEESVRFSPTESCIVASDGMDG